MKIVKLSGNTPKSGLLRQTPKNDGIWGNYKFIINEDLQEADYWVVFSKGLSKAEKCKVRSNSSLLLMGEPKAIYEYSGRFIRQFDKIITAQPHIRHKNIKIGPPAQPWWLGRNVLNKFKNKFDNDEDIKYTLDYMNLSKSFLSYKKKQLVVISSNKNFSKGHKKRLDFVEKLKEKFGDHIDYYGKGFNSFNDKWEVLKEYKYHIVLENTNDKDYWTEKLADCFLAECMPLYWGSVNIEDYFSLDSLIKLDTENPEKAIEQVGKVLESDLYLNRYEAIKLSKKRILEEYNIFPYLINSLEEMEIINEVKRLKVIKGEKLFFSLNNVKIFLKRIMVKYLG